MGFIVSIIGFLVIGLVAGFLARAIVPGKDSMSLLQTLLLGVVGSVVFGVILGLIPLWDRDKGFGPAGWIGSIIGAVLTLMVYNRVVKKNAAS
ncbi:GlsB/YeaQ/YmgE family stress response membrane protein [Mumia sp. zg.B53]|uniref:GlsB/YeaQ/YmgE family stress response membrane protein n=1 Tax=unclassified Mumia TaxID=2621872 RepID=UPI001C6F4FB8|nr:MULTISPECIES: GlsB/YeaQ/YmgE family stress response membrane protein [unclassified Mumia]MBW9207254.1 GlsB/YeaQ/YmgE family stress response membrane protein [Mumia sp. zg.B17]MBW9210398.1 GlsB/YeaQ/YmgE family stress response membrane protein [Mumia sp. zg.B21]MBW9215020.1 GlsB/YeaQ/YmgE family stress response membrane protein [Mumia sp. zg.B53]MDD9348720.1 GlsB/YeaQ/YmgE family stress response membrane protein [Mumia sp.]